MKKRLLSIGLVCAALVVGGSAMAQKEAKVGQTSNYPTIDGEVADWDLVPAYPVNVAHGTEVTTWSAESNITVSGTITARYKAVWDVDNLYVLVEVPDDDFYPHTESGKASYESDKPEIYFDVNAEIKDGQGAKDAGTGHYQVAPGIDEAIVEGGEFAFVYYGEAAEDATNYGVEYKIPMSMFLDADGVTWDPASQPTIGFDITVIDLDEAGKSDGGATETGRQRINFNNDASTDEGWNNLDDSGLLTFVTDKLGSKNEVANVSVLATNLVVNGQLELTVEVADVKVMNTVGQVVATSTDVSNLTNGVYIVAVTTIDGDVVANRFVKR